MKKFYQFKNGQEMLDVLQVGRDLYCKDTGSYAFVYNDAGSICFYTLSDEEAEKLRKDQEKYNDYWSAFLGVGGDIYDDPNYEEFNEDLTTNLEICNECFNEGLWEDVTEAEVM